MPISVAPDDAQRRVTAIATGMLTLTELTEFFCVQQSGDRQHWPVLLDATGATTVMSADDAESLADGLKTAIAQTGPHGPVAIIAADHTLFCVVRICQMLCEKRGVNVRACRRLQTAERWLVLTLETG